MLSVTYVFISVVEPPIVTTASLAVGATTTTLNEFTEALWHLDGETEDAGLSSDVIAAESCGVGRGYATVPG
jgi:hypothetical protein